MKSVRIEPLIGTRDLMVSVVCDCGENVTTNETNSSREFKHIIQVGSVDIQVLVCRCGRKYDLNPQQNHVHVSNRN